MVVARPRSLHPWRECVTVESQVPVDRYAEWLQPAAGDLDFADISSRLELRCSAKNTTSKAQTCLRWAVYAGIAVEQRLSSWRAFREPVQRQWRSWRRANWWRHETRWVLRRVVASVSTPRSRGRLEASRRLASVSPRSRASTPRSRLGLGLEGLVHIPATQVVQQTDIDRLAQVENAAQSAGADTLAVTLRNIIPAQFILRHAWRLKRQRIHCGRITADVNKSTFKRRQTSRKQDRSRHFLVLVALTRPDILNK